jgi:hypothetical protein
MVSGEKQTRSDRQECHQEKKARIDIEGIRTDDTSVATSENYRPRAKNANYDVMIETC